MSLMGSLVNGALGVGMSAQEQQYNSDQAAENRVYQTAERLATQAYMTEMWEKSNEYNSIGSQLSRARAAGVSPSAIIGGGYKSATASPMSSTPMSGNMASSNSAGALGSAFMGSFPNMLNSVGNTVKNFTDSFIARDMLGLNKQFIISQIHLNYGSLSERLANAGVAEATEQQIYTAMRWIEPLNYATYQEKIANLTHIYNSCYVQLQELEIMRGRADSQNAVDASTIKLNESTAGINDANAEAQRIRNIYLEDQQKAFTTIQEAEAFEADLRVVVADSLGVPLGSSVFEFNYGLWKTGQLPEFCNEVIVPTEQSRWQPDDWVVSIPMSSRDYFYGYPFNPLQGYYSWNGYVPPFSAGVPENKLPKKVIRNYSSGKTGEKIDVRKRADEILKRER